jgi:putative redox protein
MVEIQLSYRGSLRCDAVHGPSQTALVTDAPVDNQGRGESFSPTDLVATALGSCMLTLMGMTANKFGWDVDGIDVRVEKHMTTKPPRRIERLVVQFTVPEAVKARLDTEARHALEHAANTCPVRLSILEAIEVPVEFGW